MCGGQDGHWDGCPNLVHPSLSPYYDLSNDVSECDRGNKVQDMEPDAYIRDILRQVAEQQDELKKDMKRMRAAITRMKANMEELNEESENQQEKNFEKEEILSQTWLVEQAEKGNKVQDMEPDAYIRDILRQVAEQQDELKKDMKRMRAAITRMKANMEELNEESENQQEKNFEKEEILSQTWLVEQAENGSLDARSSSRSQELGLGKDAVLRPLSNEEETLASVPKSVKENKRKRASVPEDQKLKKRVARKPNKNAIPLTVESEAAVHREACSWSQNELRRYEADLQWVTDERNSLKLLLGQREEEIKDLRAELAKAYRDQTDLSEQIKRAKELEVDAEALVSDDDDDDNDDGDGSGHWDSYPNSFYPSSSSNYDISDNFYEFDRNKVENVEYDAHIMDMMRQIMEQTQFLREQTHERRKEMENLKAINKRMKAKIEKWVETFDDQQVAALVDSQEELQIREESEFQQEKIFKVEEILSQTWLMEQAERLEIYEVQREKITDRIRDLIERKAELG
ncbi:uncharacterized protein [Nicotiana tomentosiformis]|uniref:uncharacterized protein n=1 Tax=Nicotiana tomentosiformis TaxID=4098 RepID=UPI00388C4F7C